MMSLFLIMKSGDYALAFRWSNTRAVLIPEFYYKLIIGLLYFPIKVSNIRRENESKNVEKSKKSAPCTNLRAYFSERLYNSCIISIPFDATAAAMDLSPDSTPQTPEHTQTRSAEPTAHLKTNTNCDKLQTVCEYWLKVVKLAGRWRWQVRSEGPCHDADRWDRETDLMLRLQGEDSLFSGAFSHVQWQSSQRKKLKARRWV